MIALESVTKRYGSKTVIRSLSFTVKPGEIVALLGPNGAGKTTTLRLIAGYTLPTEGRVMVAGYDMATQHLEAARRLGYLPEHPPLYDTLTVHGYLRFVAKAKGIARAEMPAELARVTDACRLEAVFAHDVYKLSKGYRQRVALAQALLGNPAVLLLDEPTIGLDPGQTQETREVIRAFGREHTVLLSTHHLAEAALLCQRVAILHQGRLLAIDTPEGLQRALAAAHRIALRVIAPAELLTQTLLSLEGVRTVHIESTAVPGHPLAVECEVEARDGIEAAIARAVAGRWELYSLERRQATLENIFLTYVRTGAAEGAA
jgi:ABC-2 type transport system ATP-binding protein